MITDSAPEYRVDIKVRNNWLLKRMAERGIRTVAELSKRTGVSLPHLYNMISLKRAPISTLTGKLSKSAAKICETLNSSPGELWPPQHLDTPLKRNRASLEMTSQDVEILIGYDHQTSPEQLLLAAEGFSQGIDQMVAGLTPRERDVLTMRFGLDGNEPMTLEAIGKTLGVTRDRIRQIEAKAVRRIKVRLKRQGVESTTDLGLDL